MVSLPITAKILPYQRNLTYLATTAVITRMGIAGMRVWENRPANNDDPALTPNQKRQGLLERFFVEVPGTLLFTVLPLHLGQDLAAKFFENVSSRLKIPQIQQADKAATGLKNDEIGTINQALSEVFGQYNAQANTHELTTSNLIYRRLFGQPKPMKKGNPGETKVVMANLAALKARLGDELYAKAKIALPNLEKGFAMALNRSTCWSILGGVLMSATCGGWLTQRLNDGTVAPVAKHWLSKRYPEKADEKTGKDKSIAQAVNPQSKGQTEPPGTPGNLQSASRIAPSPAQHLHNLGTVQKSFGPTSLYALPPSIPMTSGFRPGAYLAYAGFSPMRSAQ